MSHIHIPDGVLPLWLVVAGWIGAIALVALAVRRASTEETRRRVPLVGAMAALMLVGMSSEIIPIAYHINLTVLAGILLGPWLSIITALVVDVMLALIGHGGVTVIGLNTLVISAEMIAGWALFRALSSAFPPRRVGLAAGAATVVALALSTTLLVVIVALGGSPAASRESGAFDPSTLSFSNPFREGVLTNATLTGQAEHAADRAAALGGSIRRDGVLAGVDRVGARGNHHRADRRLHREGETGARLERGASRTSARAARGRGGAPIGGPRARGHLCNAGPLGASPRRSRRQTRGVRARSRVGHREHERAGGRCDLPVPDRGDSRTAPSDEADLAPRRLPRPVRGAVRVRSSDGPALGGADRGQGGHRGARRRDADVHHALPSGVRPGTAHGAGGDRRRAAHDVPLAVPASREVLTHSHGRAASGRHRGPKPDPVGRHDHALAGRRAAVLDRPVAAHARHHAPARLRRSACRDSAAFGVPSTRRGDRRDSGCRAGGSNRVACVVAGAQPVRVGSVCAVGRPARRRAARIAHFGRNAR